MLLPTPGPEPLHGLVSEVGSPASVSLGVLQLRGGLGPVQRRRRPLGVQTGGVQRPGHLRQGWVFDVR